MDGVLKSEIFFFVATIALVLISAVLIVVMVYVIRVMRDLKDITSLVRKQAGQISEDIDQVRARIKNEDSLWTGLSSAYRYIFGKGKGRKKNDK